MTPQVFGLRLECPATKQTKIYVCPGVPDEDEQDKIEAALDFDSMKWEDADNRVKRVLNGVPVGQHKQEPEYEYVFWLEMEKQPSRKTKVKNHEQCMGSVGR